MNERQKQILDLLKSGKDLSSMSLRGIAELIGAKDRPQTAKYHLKELEKAGLINLDLKTGVIKLVKTGYNKPVTSSIYSLPIVGKANCGPATIFAETNIEKYLKVSTKMLPRNKSKLYGLIAEGNSMNLAKTKDGQTIEDGDFVIVNKDNSEPSDGEIIVAVIDGMGTIKEYNRKGEAIILKARSTEDYLPIYIHEGDDFSISGKVVGVIKS
jgi:SOS regulatory protein LexA